MADKKIYFKIIELPDYQVLISKEQDEKEQDEDVRTLKITFHMDDVKLNYTLGYDKEDVDMHFDKFNEKDAQLFVNHGLETLGG